MKGIVYVCSGSAAAVCLRVVLSPLSLGQLPHAALPRYHRRTARYRGSTAELYSTRRRQPTAQAPQLSQSAIPTSARTAVRRQVARGTQPRGTSHILRSHRTPGPPRRYAAVPLPLWLCPRRSPTSATWPQPPAPPSSDLPAPRRGVAPSSLSPRRACEPTPARRAWGSRGARGAELAPAPQACVSSGHGEGPWRR
eukprot:SAG31_NODE_342_length_17455_cov_6.381251_8_plen_196_part_00